jgi:hypothetical protein
MYVLEYHTTEFEYKSEYLNVDPVMSIAASDSSIPLPKFLKELTNNGIAVPKAMAVAGKML